MNTRKLPPLLLLFLTISFSAVADTTPPAAPVNLVAVAGDQMISLSWDENTEGDLAGYSMYRSTTSGTFGTALVTQLTSGGYLDTTASNGTTYFYVVKAVDTFGNESVVSLEVSATPSASEGVYSPLWGSAGELWEQGSSLLRDFTTVGYMQGAVPIPDWPVGVDVTDFGAVGDGVNDDTQAFRDAIAACPDNHAIRIPNGRYRITEQIALGPQDNSHFVLRGEDMFETVLFFPLYLTEIYGIPFGKTARAGIPENEGFFRFAGGTHRSFENLAFEFREQPNGSHWEFIGADPIYFTGVEDSWIRNVYFKNGDQVVYLWGGDTKNISVINVIFDQYIDRSNRGRMGHMPLAVSSSYSLFHNVLLTGKWEHDILTNQSPLHNVWSKYRGPDIEIDHHSAGSDFGLFTEIYGGLGSTNQYDFYGSNESYWNLQSDMEISFSNPDNHNVIVGVNTPDPTATGASFWHENIEPQSLYPSNLYLSQLDWVGKPRPMEIPLVIPQSQDEVLVLPVTETGPLKMGGSADTNLEGGTLRARSTYQDNNTELFLLKFDFSEMGLTLVPSATVRISGNYESALRIWTVNDDSWSSDTVTYNTAPAGLTELTYTVAQDSTLRDWVDVDVTQFVQTELQGDGVITLLVEAPGSGNNTFAQKDSGGQPRLIIEPVATTPYPATPTGLTATLTEEGLLLDWDDSPETDFRSYTLHRTPRIDDEVPGLALGLVDSQFLDKLIEGDTVYTYSVSVIDTGTRESLPSTELQITPAALAPPEAPVGLNATARDSMVLLDWDDNTDFDISTYNVYRSTTSGSQGTLIASGLTTSEYTDSSVVNNQFYYYVVSAVDSAGLESVTSDEDGALPSPTVSVDLAASRNASFSGSSNYDESEYLYLRNAFGTGNDSYAYLRFPMNAVAGTIRDISFSDVVSVRLKFTVTSASAEDVAVVALNDLADADDINLDGDLNTDTYLSETTWTEANLSGLNRPDGGRDAPNDLTSSRLASIPSGGFGLTTLPEEVSVSLDVTLFKDLLTNSSNDEITLILTGPKNGPMQVASLTNTNGYLVPTLEITTVTSALSTPPAQPTGLFALSASNEVSLDWDDNGEQDLASYSIYRSTTSGNFSSPLVTDLTSSDFVDSTAANGITYYYVVTATNTNGDESVVSDEVPATPTDTTPPAAPTGLVATAGDGAVSLDWADNGEADFASYTVYRSETSGSYGVALMTGLTASDYVDSTAVNDTLYYYVVTAIDTNNNESSLSVEGSATPIAVNSAEVPVSANANFESGSTNLDVSEVLKLRNAYGYHNDDYAYLRFPVDALNNRIGGIASANLTSVTLTVTVVSATEETVRVVGLTDLADADDINLDNDPTIDTYLSETSWTAANLTGLNAPDGDREIPNDLTTANLVSSTGVLGSVSSPTTWTITLDLATFQGLLTNSSNGEITLIVNGPKNSDMLWASLGNSNGYAPPTLVLTSDVPVDTTPPAAPAGLNVFAGIGSVGLDWDDNSEPDFADYTVYRSTVSGGGYSLLATTVSASEYVDTDIQNNTTYYYVVTAADTTGNESENSPQASGQPGWVANMVAVSTPVLGSVSGSVADVDASDDSYQSITEVLSGSTSALEHKWEIDVVAAELVTLYIEAHHSANPEGDEFILSYSTDNVNYIDLLTLSKTLDDNALQWASLPGGLSGTVYIRVLDADRTDGNTQLDTVYIDQLFIVSEESTTAPASASAPAPSDAEAAVAINVDLNWTAGPMAASHDVYFGTDPNPAFQGNQSGTTFDPGLLLNGTTYYWAVDEVNNSGTTTGALWSFTTVALPSGPQLATGVLSGVDDTWQVFSLPTTYGSPVIVATIVYENTTDIPVVPRIRNAAGNSFELKVQNPSGTPLSGPYTVHIMAVEEGVYTTAEDGIMMEAIKVVSTGTNNKTDWNSSQMEQLTPSNSYTNPVVLGQVLTANDSNWSAFWSCNGNRQNPATASAMFVGKHVAEDLNTTRTNETLGVIVLDAGSGTMDGVAYTAGVGSDTLRGMDNGPGYTYSLSGLPSASVAAVSSAAMDGADGGWAALYGTSPLSATTLNLVIDEDQVKDSERSHTTEQASYLVFE